jgi:hypothetical protein
MKYDYATEQAALKRVKALQDLHDGIESVRDEIHDLTSLARQADMPEVKWTLIDIRRTLNSCNEDVANDLENDAQEAARQKEAHGAEENREYVADIGPAHY